MHLRGDSRRSIVVQVGEPRTGDHAARALASSLSGFGIEATYVGRHDDAEPIAVAVAAAHADSVELCLCRGTGVPILRDLLRELIRIGKREVAIVVHRVDWSDIRRGCRIAWKRETAQRKTGVPATWAMNASEPVTYAGRE